MSNQPRGPIIMTPAQHARVERLQGLRVAIHRALQSTPGAQYVLLVAVPQSGDKATVDMAASGSAELAIAMMRGQIVALEQQIQAMRQAADPKVQA